MPLPNASRLHAYFCCVTVWHKTGLVVSGCHVSSVGAMDGAFKQLASKLGAPSVEAMLDSNVMEECEVHILEWGDGRVMTDSLTPIV